MSTFSRDVRDHIHDALGAHDEDELRLVLAWLVQRHPTRVAAAIAWARDVADSVSEQPSDV